MYVTNYSLKHPKTTCKCNDFKIDCQAVDLVIVTFTCSYLRANPTDAPAGASIRRMLIIKSNVLYGYNTLLMLILLIKCSV